MNDRTFDNNLLNKIESNFLTAACEMSDIMKWIEKNTTDMITKYVIQELNKKRAEEI